ncbi:MAG: NAD-binding protein [Caldilineaceae bacterium]|nr:NAD-binding protein [Caldilineaceae bacterium]
MVGNSGGWLSFLRRRENPIEVELPSQEVLELAASNPDARPAERVPSAPEESGEAEIESAQTITERTSTVESVAKTSSRAINRVRRKSKKKEFVVIGLGRFGASVAQTLVDYGHNVLALDIDATRVQHLSTTLPHVAQLDATNMDALLQAGVDSFETGVVCIGTDFESGLLACVLLQRLGVKQVVAKARTRTQKDILLRIGVEEVILPEHEAGVRLGRRLEAGNLVDYLEVSDNIGVVEMVAPPALVNHTLAESEMRQRYGLTAMAVRRNDELFVSPSAAFRILEGDVLIVMGRLEDAERVGE